MTDSRFEHLDAIAIEVAKGNRERTHVLSTGESLYVALAANDAEMLEQLNCTIAEALDRLGEKWCTALIENWRYRGNPTRL